MALIGTISGSVGIGDVLVSTTAISGTLIIADAPASSFPTLQSGVKLFVSGSKTTLGADSPSAIFGGDTFVSGALGTDSYVQMKPVGTLQVPTNTTASYIYTSGSTNDLYFTQYQPGTGYTNTTRLRWLEGVLTSGLLHGGILSTTNGTTTFSVTSGSGMIVVPNASTGSDPYPTIQYVEWSQFTSSSLVYSGTAQVTFIAIDSSGSLEQMNTAPTLRDYKNKIVLGRVLHQTGSVTNGTANAPAMSFSAAANIFDFVRPFGPLKVSGHVLTASGSTLSLTKTAGDSYSEGRNYAFDPSNPNTILAADDPDVTVSKIYYQHVSGSTTITNTGVGNAGFTVIDPAQYNNNGTLAPVGNSEWTNQRVYWFPRAVNRALFVYYGSRKYGTLLEAVAGINVESFIEGGNTKESAIFVGTISVKGNELSLTNATAQISQAGLFRGSAGGGGGGGGSTPPAGLDTYVQFNDGGTIFGGDSGFTYNKTTDSITVAGNITGSNLRLTGDATVVGGDITTEAATFNFVDATATTFNLARAATTITAGAVGGSTTFQGDITGSNTLLTGDLAVNGGDITTTSAIANMFATNAVTMNFGPASLATVVNLNRTTNVSTTNIATGNNASATKSINIGGNTGAAATCTISIGSSGSLGRTTLQQDVALTTGNLIGAPGSGANVMTLISSGNIIARLDTDNSAPGHKFAVQDYLNADKFSITEAGAAEIADTLFATGSITTSGSLRSVASVGSEGGEIFLSSPASSTTINTGVNIDVYQDKVRIFESGGSTRGGYYDVTKLGASVSTDLLRGDPLFAFINRKILILQAMDGNTGSGNFGVFPFSMATTVANTGQIITNGDNFLAFTSLATIGSAAIFRTTNVWARIGHTGRIRGRIVTGADITSQTITFGLGTGTSSTGANNSFSFTPSPAEQRILAVYNAGTANWLLLTSDGVSSSTADTGIAVAINTEYYFDLQFTGASVSLSVNNSTPVSLSTNLPAAGTSMYARMGIYPTANAARTMNVFRCVFEAGTPSVY